VDILSPNAQGYALATQMAEIAIETYGLTIKSVNLSDVQTVSGLFLALQANVNAIVDGERLPLPRWPSGVTASSAPC